MRALLLFCLLLTGCRTTYPEGAAVKSADGHILCAKHHVALVTTRAYQVYINPNSVVLGPHDAVHPLGGIISESYPNIIPEVMSLHRTESQTEPITIRYCPLCEEQFLKERSVPDHRAAVKFAQYVLPIWGGGGVATKPPYQVSLRGDVWTVSCFLVDGRRAIIKFSKKEGSVISTEYGKRNSSNQAMQPTAGRSEAASQFMKTPPFQSTRALASGG